MTIVQPGRCQLTSQAASRAGTVTYGAEINISSWAIEAHGHALLVEYDSDGLGIGGGIRAAIHRWRQMLLLCSCCCCAFS